MSDALFNLSQGNPALQPQLSKSFTAGFELRPPSIPTFNIVTSFFHTRFDDLIGAAAVPGGLLNVLANAPYFAPFINRSPNYAYLQQLFASGIVTDIAGPGFTPLGPNAVQVVVDGRLQNLSVATQSGIDASSSYTVITSHGDLGLSVAGTHFLRYDYQPVVGLPALTLANRVGEPLSWKANGGVHWTSGVFHSDLLVNYANAYLNDYLSPPTRIASWTTVDLNLAYQPNPSAVHTHLKGLSAALTIQNLFDRPPPSVQIPAGLVTQSLGFDPANASAVGRFIALQLRYNW
jgi:outer membrane receptor protein involved in Fe transport